MRLHENRELFSQAIRAAAEYKGIREVYIEKDYWVTLALKTIFKHPDCGDAIFKGGTALSKCFNMVERFSEDIDLVVVRHEKDSNNSMTKKIKAITNAVEEVLPEVKVEGITRKRGKNRKLAHTYSKVFSGAYGQVRDVVIVEASWLGSSEPNVEHTISSYIYEMMVAKDQQNLVSEYELGPFEVRVLAIERTLCEKIMSLIRFSYDEDPVGALKNKIRHCYDLHLMLQNDEINTFICSERFDELLSTVAHDDVTSYRAAVEWLAIHPAEALIFSDIETVWNQLKPVYEQEFSALVYGDLPEAGSIKKTLIMIQNRLIEIDWSLEIEDGS